MDEESLRNRLLNRLKDQQKQERQEQQQSITHEDVGTPSIPMLPNNLHLNSTVDSEISSAEMADSIKGDDENIIHKTHKLHKQDRYRKGKRNEIKLEKNTQDRKPNQSKKLEEKREDKKKMKVKHKDKQQKSVVKLKKEISPSRSSPSITKRAKYKRESSPDRNYRRRRKRSDSRDSKYNRRTHRYRSRTPVRRKRADTSHNRDRYYRKSSRENRYSPERGRRTMRDSRNDRNTQVYRRRYHSRSRSRSFNRYTDSESTTSFSISTYGSDIETSLKEKNVMPATSTTSGDRGVPSGFGQGLYIPQLNQADKNKGGIGDLLTAIRQGQNQQSKSTAIAQYTAIFQRISEREVEQTPNTEEPAIEITQESNQPSKFKLVEQEFPVSHGSEHRKATFNSEIGVIGNQIEEQLFTDPASINRMMLGINPGKYIGDKAVCLPMNLLEGGDPAWVKKHQFKRLAPVGDGIGRKLMEKMGWKEGMPLGKSGYGAITPIEPDVKTDRKGLGVGSSKDLLCLPLPPMNNIPNYNPVAGDNSMDISDPSARLFEPNALAGGKHPVCVLMEICAKRHWTNPVFEEVGEQGPKSFKYRVRTSMGCYQPSITSVNKKDAKRHAALACLQALGQVPCKPMDVTPTNSIPQYNIQQQPPMLHNISLMPQFPISAPRHMPLLPQIYPPPLPQAPSYLHTNAHPGAISHMPVYQKPFTM
ncbi:hypothetical protein LOD99_12762 [Oopsacas minuta]|uniref:SON n=1 Tax=Oopsacas minuta TaxID=111878 RepID=A0AAV7JD63_9METZ|nr:hypothetical protein LOD99_12762 [Oopsacas minuta]